MTSPPKTEVILGKDVREGDFLLYTINPKNGTRQAHWNVKAERHEGKLGWWKEYNLGWGRHSEEKTFRPFDTVDYFATTKLEVRSPRPETDNEWGAISP